MANGVSLLIEVNVVGTDKFGLFFYKYAIGYMKFKYEYVPTHSVGDGLSSSIFSRRIVHHTCRHVSWLPKGS